MENLQFVISTLLAIATAPFLIDSWRRFGHGYMKKLTLGVGFTYICGLVYSIAPLTIADPTLLDQIGRICVSLFFVGIIYLNYILNTMSRKYGFNLAGKKISNASKKH